MDARKIALLSTLATLGAGTAAFAGPCRVISLSAGEGYSLAVTNDGEVFAWGLDPGASRVPGVVLGRNVPVLLYGLADVAAVAAGTAHALAIKTDGTVWAWG